MWVLLDEGCSDYEGAIVSAGEDCSGMGKINQYCSIFVLKAARRQGRPLHACCLLEGRKTNKKC